MVRNKQPEILIYLIFFDQLFVQPVLISHKIVTVTNSHRRERLNSNHPVVKTRRVALRLAITPNLDYLRSRVSDPSAN